MNPQSTYPYEEREDFREGKERDLYYEAQASNKPRERNTMTEKEYEKTLEDEKNLILTAGDLIEKLSKVPADTRIIVSGYEGGYSTARHALTKPIILKYHTSDWSGPHELCGQDEIEDGHKADEDAVLITASSIRFI